MKFVGLGQGIQNLEPEQDRHTGWQDWKYYHATFVFVNNRPCLLSS